MRLNLLGVNLIIFSYAYAQAHPCTPLEQSLKPVSKLPSFTPFLMLAVDSTTATQSSNEGGYGDGFLHPTLCHEATRVNFGHHGATTVSFQAGADWNKLFRCGCDARSCHAFVSSQLRELNGSPTYHPEPRELDQCHYRCPPPLLCCLYQLLPN